ncbi:MAG: methyltransferase domain-containing protein [Planctomycetota bacterium]
MIHADLLPLLRCPVCHGALVANASALRCPDCDTAYTVRAGVPDLVPPTAETGADWDTWRAHLEAFQQRREHRSDEPKKLVNRMTRSGGPQQVAFAEFTEIRDGVVLDIGCGPGKFRFQLPDSVLYIGMDPIPLPEASEFAFIRGVAEHLPLPNQSVRHITVLSALDHFKDCEAFLREAVRILEPGGRLHVVQQVHEHGFSIRGLAHWVKDSLEDRSTKHDDSVPHHMTEFDRGDLSKTFARHFTVEREQLYSMSFYTPRRVFLTLAPAP